MAPSLPRNQASPPQPVVFGKLPNRADFVRINVSHPLAHEFDLLTQSALEKFRLQEGWEERYDSNPMMDICYTSRDQKWLFLGGMVASRDQSGRRYPLVAGLVFLPQAVSGAQMLLPIAGEVFFEGLREQLANATENSVEAMGCHQFLESQALTWTQSASELELAGQIVKQFMDSRHPFVLGPALASAHQPGSVTQALLNLLFYRDFLRRFYSPSAIQLIEVPLQTGPGEAALHACAWLSLLSSLAGGPEVGLGGFLIRQGRGADRANLYFSLGPMPDKVLLSAMGGMTPEEGRLNLGSEQKTWQAHKLYAETAYAMDRFINDPAVTLTSLSGFTRELSQKIANAKP